MNKLVETKIETFSTKGPVREANEDGFWAIKVETPTGIQTLVAVCDGVGGLKNGSWASRVTLETIKASVMEEWGILSVQKGLAEANRIIFESFQGKDPSQKSGTTCSVLLINEGTLTYEGLHVGDSRIYQARNSQSIILTKDHTLYEKLKEEGGTWEESEEGRIKSTLTKCVGVSPGLVPDKLTGSFEPGDMFTLASDGFWHSLQAKYFQRDLAITLAEVSDFGYKMGERDNMTAITVRVSEVL